MIRQIDNTIKSKKFVEILLNEHYYISVFQELKYTEVKDENLLIFVRTVCITQ